MTASPRHGLADNMPPAYRSRAAVTTQNYSWPDSLYAISIRAILRRMADAHTNRLAQEKSPYLLQHAHNPVDWFAWGDEAFARARAEIKPVFLSIGYSACHWCHVMERESFEDEKVG